MTKKEYKRKGILTNHQDCINQMDGLHTKLEEKESDYNNLLLQNNTLKGIVEKQCIEISDLKKKLCDSQSQIQSLTSSIISQPVKVNVVDTPEYIQLETERNELFQKQEEMENIMDELGVNDNFGGLLEFLKLLYENKNEFIEYVNIKKNKIVHDIKYEKNIPEGKIKDALDNQKKIYDEKFEEINKTHKEEINKIKSQYEDYKQCIPTPSTSTDIKEKDINIDKQSIINEITSKLESKFSLEKDEIKNEYNSIIENIKEEKNKIKDK